MPTSAAPQPGAERKRRARKNRKAMSSPEGECSACSESHEENEVREGVEDSECCAEKKGKPKCSACAAGKPCSGRGDALTAQDYLTACDLGIADRSRPYIRARLDAMSNLTPAAVRNDLRAASATPGRAGKKCGNSYIPASANCNAGQGGAPQQKGSKLRRGLENAAIAGGLAVQVGGFANGIRQTSKGNFKAATRSFAASNAGSVLTGAGLRAKGKRTGNEEMQKSGRKIAVQGAAGAALGLAASGDLSRAGRAVGRAAAGMANRGPRRLGTSALAKPRTSLRTKAGKAAYQASYAAGRAAGSARNAYRRAGAGVASYMGRRNARRGSYTTTTVPYGGALARRDTIWADGFTPELASLEA